MLPTTLLTLGSGRTIVDIVKIAYISIICSLGEEIAAFTTDYVSDFDFKDFALLLHNGQSS